MRKLAGGHARSLTATPEGLDLRRITDALARHNVEYLLVGGWRRGRMALDGIVVRVAALDDVIASKEWANRPQDRDALPELRLLRGE